MPIVAACGHCGKSYAVAERYAGRQGRCTRCGGTVRFPAGPPAAEVASGAAPPVKAARTPGNRPPRRTWQVVCAAAAIGVVGLIGLIALMPGWESRNFPSLAVMAADAERLEQAGKLDDAREKHDAFLRAIGDRQLKDDRLVRLAGDVKRSQQRVKDRFQKLAQAEGLRERQRQEAIQQEQAAQRRREEEQREQQRLAQVRAQELTRQRELADKKVAQAREEEARRQREAEELRKRQLSPEEIVAASEKAVALIRCGTGTGTGFLIRPGWLVTNHHVIRDTPIDRIKVYFPGLGERGKEPLPVTRLLHIDKARDLAILSVTSDVPPLRLAEAHQFRRGQGVTVIGNPGIGEEVLEN